MVIQFLVAAGYSEADAATAADGLVTFETEISKVSLSTEEQANYTANYVPKTVAELEEELPGMGWAEWAKAVGLSDNAVIAFADFNAISALDGIIEKTPVEALRAYFIRDLLWTYADFLSDDLLQIKNSLYEAIIGPQPQAPINERVIGQLNDSIPWAVGKMYVETYFSPEARQEAITMVDYELQALRNRIHANTWMSDSAKQEALKKIDTLVVRVGYPDAWETYADLEIGTTYAQTQMNAVAYQRHQDFALAGQKTDPNRWINPPQNVNGSYDPSTNSINVSAAFFQAPFFYPGATAWNFAGAGGVIAHELMHGFDSSGSQFDSTGNLNPWFTDEDSAAFAALSDRVVQQYDGIEVAPGSYVNGTLTLNENLADMGGSQIAYDAMHLYLADHGSATPVAATPVMATPIVSSATPGATPVVSFDLANATPDQIFFISWANSNRSAATPEMVAAQVQNDFHAPDIVRAVEPLRNMDAFYEAFNIQPGDPMWLAPADRIHVW